MSIKKIIASVLILIPVVFFLGSFLFVKPVKTFKVNSEITGVFQALNDTFFKESSYPEVLTSAGEDVSINFSINKRLDEFLRKKLARYDSDYTSVVAIDNNTGAILSAVSYDGIKNEFNNFMAFSTTHPGASLIKIITGAAVLKKDDVALDTTFKFKGRSSTLYKHQLREAKGRWVRKQSFSDAFARSNNVIFGKAAQKYLSDEEIYEEASQFGFNEPLMVEIPHMNSIFSMPTSDYNLAEKASGMNRETLMSPLHAAVLSSIVANRGILKYPRLVMSLDFKKSKEKYWSNMMRIKRVLKEETSDQLSEMMTDVIKKGTARRSFRRIKRTVKKKLIIGGKTGSITGGAPYGKRDWFTTFAVPQDRSQGSGISIGIMVINKEKWKVKSAKLAREVIEFYFNHLDPISQNVAMTSR